MHRSLVFGTIKRYVEDCPSNGTANPLIVSQNETWDFKMRLYRDVVVSNGATLTLKCTLQMPYHGKITVEKGAKLILDGATITSSCNYMWDGIVVMGDKNMYQLSVTPNVCQGWVILQNSAIIENAFVGIKTGNDENTASGIIRAVNSTFRNNQIAVEFLPYRNFSSSNSSYTMPNISSFSNCTFEINQELPRYDYFLYFVKMNDVSGVKFIGSTFNNYIAVNGYTNIDERGYGFYTINSKYTINSSFARISGQLIRKSVFSGLRYGVYALNTSPERNIVIENTDFTTNYFDIYLSGYKDARIVSNNFEVSTNGINVVNCEEPRPYGIYLDECSHYHLENNFLKSFESEIGMDNRAIVINKSGESLSKVYNNTFENVYGGVSAQYKNRGLLIESGLKIICNDFNSTFPIYSMNDIFVIGNDALTQGIAEYQGTEDNPAGNRFSINNPTMSNFFNSTQCGNVLYYHHDQTSEPRVIPNRPYNVTLRDTRIPFWKLQACPLTIISPNREVLRQNLEYNRLQKIISKNMMNTMIDGGFTNDMVVDVENTVTAETWQTYNKLLSESPYLSEEVMVKLIENETTFPAILVKLLLVANPQSAVSKKVMEAIENRVFKLPDYMVEEIKNGKNVRSAFEAIRGRYVNFAEKYAWNFQQLMESYKNDTIIDNKDSIINLLKTDTSFTSLYELLFLYLNDNKENEYQNTLDILQSMAISELGRMEEVNNYLKYFEAFTNIKENGIEKISNDNIQTLFDVMYSESSFISAYARNVLIWLGLVNYQEPILSIENQKNLPYQKANTKLSNAYLKVYPNPAKDYVVIEYKDVTSGANLIITDVFGKIAYSNKLAGQNDQILIETSTWNAGLYYCRLLVNEKNIDVKKISIVK